MPYKLAIQTRLMRVMLLTCGIVLALTCAAFFIYEYIAYKNITRNELITISNVIGENSSAALLFDNQQDATEVLNTLKNQKTIIEAVIFDKENQIFAVYERDKSQSFEKTFQLPEKNGFIFKDNSIIGKNPIVQNNDHIGTIYIKADLSDLYHRFRLYGLIAGSILIVSLLLAYFISTKLQRSISSPILDLANKARVVSQQGDYSIRATKINNDEVGILTDAFNHMLTRIEEQHEEIYNLNINLEEKILQRTEQLVNANTALLQQNELIEAILDSSIDLIAVFDKNLNYLIINKYAAEVYNKTKEDIIGKNIEELFPVLRGKALIQNLKRALNGEFIHLDAYKSEISDIWLQNYFIPLRDSNNKVNRVLLLGHDITGIMKNNEQLQNLNSQLEKSNRDLEEFAYVASHDLQEPLRKIQIFSDLMERNLNKEDLVKMYLGKISGSASRMSSLIQAVLNYSRLSKNKMVFAPVDLNEIIQNIKTDLELLIAEKNAIIEVEKLPVITGISLQLNQLFLNLFTNALKFSENNTHIKISCKKVEGSSLDDIPLEKTHYYEITFSDNGIGFDQKYANQIFSIFERLHTGKEFSGTGIGLALCKKIVENHNGIISVKSEKNVGTSFFIYLPVQLNVGQNNKEKSLKAIGTGANNH